MTVKSVRKVVDVLFTLVLILLCSVLAGIGYLLWEIIL